MIRWAATICIIAATLYLIFRWLRRAWWWGRQRQGGGRGLKVAADGKVYSFSFEHGKVGGTDYTTCSIWEVVESDECHSVKISRGSGTVTRWIGDTPNRVVARKAALEKALKVASLPADIRKEFWDVWLAVGRVKGVGHVGSNLEG